MAEGFTETAALMNRARFYPTRTLDNKPPRRSTIFNNFKLVKPWILLIFHLACSIAVALAIVLGLNGYEAGDDSSPRFEDNGRVLLRVSDITTLVSVALLAVKMIVASWSTTLLWASARYLLFRSGKPASQKTVLSMLRGGTISLVRHQITASGGRFGWAIALALLASVLQALTAPC
jgi:hypothetical protein